MPAVTVSRDEVHGGYIDLAQHELRNPRLQNLGSAPASPVVGQVYMDTTTSPPTLRYYDGTQWTDPLARSNHTGTQLASTISNFDAAVRTSRLDQMAAPTTDVSMASHRLINLADPSAAQDAATKAYVDAAAAGIDWKGSVRVATAAALPAYTRVGNVITANANGALPAIDGVTLVSGDRLLLKDGAAGSDNGLYSVTQVGAGGSPFVLTRTADADTSAEVTAGLGVFVADGTVNADSGWVLSTNDPITLNTTALVFTQFTSLGQVTAGAGLTKSGSTLDVGSGNGISVGADSVAVDPVVTERHAVGALSGGSNSEVLTHNLGTRDVTVTIRNNSAPYDEVLIYNEATSTNAVTVYAAAGATLPASYRWKISG